MFNLQKHKVAQVTSYEKYLRQNSLGPKDNDGQSIHEKELPHRKGEQYTTTEDQMRKNNKNTIVKDDSDIIEKVLNEANGGYVVHRSDDKWDIQVPPINATVEKIRQNRVESDYKTKKESHWSISYNEKKQQGKLPKWTKSPDQHDAITLNNDPRRFSEAEGFPIHEDQRENDKEHSKKPKIKPLIGKITTANIDNVVTGIKTGQSIEYDTAIVAILREAEKEKRELTTVEQKTISDLKISRTNVLLAQQMPEKVLFGITLDDTIHGNPGEKRVLPAGTKVRLETADNIPEGGYWAHPLDGHPWPKETEAWAESVGVHLMPEDIKIS